MGKCTSDKRLVGKASFYEESENKKIYTVCARVQ